jgi:hypothetical protein
MNRLPFRAGCALATLLAAAACHQKVASPSAQYGANPALPAPQQYLVPPMQVPPGVG